MSRQYTFNADKAKEIPNTNTNSNATGKGSNPIVSGGTNLKAKTNARNIKNSNSSIINDVIVELIGNISLGK